LGRGVGLGDAQRSLPTPTILGFCEPSAGQVPAVWRAGLGLPAAAGPKIGAHGSPTSASPARGCGPEGLGLLLPPPVETGSIGGRWIADTGQAGPVQQHRLGRVRRPTAVPEVAETPAATSPVPGRLCSAAAEEVRGRLRPCSSSHVWSRREVEAPWPPAAARGGTSHLPEGAASTRRLLRCCSWSGRRGEGQSRTLGWCSIL